MKVIFFKYQYGQPGDMIMGIEYGTNALSAAQDRIQSSGGGEIVGEIDLGSYDPTFLKFLEVVNELEDGGAFDCGFSTILLDAFRAGQKRETATVAAVFATFP